MKKVGVIVCLILTFIIIYLLSLFQLVTSGDLNVLRGNNFIPFKEISQYASE